MKIHAAEDVGMSSERLARINTYLDSEVADDRLPGIIALAARRGKIVHHSLHGKMDIAANRPMAADAIFRIYSMTKPIVSTMKASCNCTTRSRALYRASPRPRSSAISARIAPNCSSKTRR